LVIRRGSQVVAPGVLCFPGGGIEPGETEPQALVRELTEELSVQVRPRICLWRSTTSWNVEIAWWQADLDENAVLLPNPAEVAAVGWFTPAELMVRDDLLESNRRFLLAVQSGVIQFDVGGVGTAGT
jgi:8-oxo-dGTP pyrophosphatase MutT (NUDIX family)